MNFAGIVRPDEFRELTRSHVIAWRDDLKYRELSGTTIRHRLAALSSLFEYLCEKNAVIHNPVKGVKRPSVEGYEGRRRPSAIIRRVAYSTLRITSCSRVSATVPSWPPCSTTPCGVKNYASSRSRISNMSVAASPTSRFSARAGKRVIFHCIRPQVASSWIIWKCQVMGLTLTASFSPHSEQSNGPLHTAITADMIYKLVRMYSAALGFKIGAHALRATAATNALDHQADIAKVQEWLGHTNIATTRIYDRRKTRPEDSNI